MEWVIGPFHLPPVHCVVVCLLLGFIVGLIFGIVYTEWVDECIRERKK